MIKVKLTEQERARLEKYRGQSSSENSEKALMVIMSAEGHSPIKIAEALKRNPHTVRKWLKQYNKEGVSGLQRQYSPGRPNDTRKQVQSKIEEILEKSPLGFDYQESLWTVALMVHYLNRQKDLTVSEDTVARALKEMGYTYKRPGKGVGDNAPTKEEKLEQVKEIIAEIQELQNREDCEIFALDESHFSTEPYLVRGWQKKGGRRRIPTSGRRESHTFFGCLNLKTRKFYWKKSKQGNSGSFILFLTQLRQRFKGKTLAIILDNSSIHTSRKVKRYLQRFPQIHLFFLPTYSPEYNPVERIWGWMKTKIYGFSAFGGINELIRRFRKLCWHFNMDRLTKPICLKLEAYTSLL